MATVLEHRLTSTLIVGFFTGFQAQRHHRWLHTVPYTHGCTVPYYGHGTCTVKHSSVCCVDGMVDSTVRCRIIRYLYGRVSIKQLLHQLFIPQQSFNVDCQGLECRKDCCMSALRAVGRRWRNTHQPQAVSSFPPSLDRL
ncbi:hypothetical protein BJV74DRAFT_59463 [Russula compacta]|nr:hypothetical protein BJV74DRAFT_59463 [Russula compacta]